MTLLNERKPNNTKPGRQPPTSAREWLYLNSKNAMNGLVFSWRLVLPGFLGRTNSEGREDTERTRLMIT